jgi:hypothetical protein
MPSIQLTKLSPSGALASAFSAQSYPVKVFIENGTADKSLMPLATGIITSPVDSQSRFTGSFVQKINNATELGYLAKNINVLLGEADSNGDCFVVSSTVSAETVGTKSYVYLGEGEKHSVEAISYLASIGFSGVIQSADNSVYSCDDGVNYLVSGGKLDAVDLAFIICGQSNADGRGSIVSPTTPHPAVIIYDKNNKIRMATEPEGTKDTSSGWVNNIPNGLSPGISGHSFGLDMAKNLLKNSNIRSCLVPCAIGSTSLTHWQPADDLYDMTTLFGAMLSRATYASINAIPVWCWVGHESESSYVTESLVTGVVGTEYASKWDAIYKKISDKFTDPIFIFAQVATHSDNATATGLRKVGEAQRRLETTYGDASTVIAVKNPTAIPIDPNLFTVIGTQNATNYIAVEGASIRLVSDGATIGFAIGTLVSGSNYRLSVTATGTGNYKVLANGTKQQGISAGTTAVSFVADGSGLLQIYRSNAGVACNLLMTINSVEEIQTVSHPLHYMIVTHDLPRNAAPDGIHLSKSGQQKLGERMALAYRQFVLGEAVNGKGPRLLTINPITKSGTIVSVKFDSHIAPPVAGQAHWSTTGAAANSNFRVYFNGVEQTITNVVLKSGDDTVIEITVPSVSGVVVVTYGDRAAPATESYRLGVVYDLDGMPAPMFGPIIAI